MSDPKPSSSPLEALSVSLLTKLGSIAVHADEYLSTKHPVDESSLNALLAAPEVAMWLHEMQALSLLPVKR